MMSKDIADATIQPNPQMKVNGIIIMANVCMKWQLKSFVICSTANMEPSTNRILFNYLQLSTAAVDNHCEIRISCICFPFYNRHEYYYDNNNHNSPPNICGTCVSADLYELLLFTLPPPPSTDYIYHLIIIVIDCKVWREIFVVFLSPNINIRALH